MAILDEARSVGECVDIFPCDGKAVFEDGEVVAALLREGVRQHPGEPRGRLFVDESCSVLTLAIVWKYVRDFSTYTRICRRVSIANPSAAFLARNNSVARAASATRSRHQLQIPMTHAPPKSAKK